MTFIQKTALSLVLTLGLLYGADAQAASYGYDEEAEENRASVRPAHHQVVLDLLRSQEENIEQIIDQNIESFFRSKAIAARRHAIKNILLALGVTTEGVNIGDYMVTANSLDDGFIAQVIKSTPAAKEESREGFLELFYKLVRITPIEETDVQGDGDDNTHQWMPQRGIPMPQTRDHAEWIQHQLGRTLTEIQAQLVGAEGNEALQAFQEQIEQFTHAFARVRAEGEEKDGRIEYLNNVNTDLHATIRQRTYDLNALTRELDRLRAQLNDHGDVPALRQALQASEQRTTELEGELNLLNEAQGQNDQAADARDATLVQILRDLTLAPEERIRQALGRLPVASQAPGNNGPDGFEA